jgi:uncharacterized membrane protein YfcA
MRGRVRFRTGFLFGLTAMLGAFVAGRLAHFIPASVLLLALALVMVATALAMLRAPAAMPSVVAATRAELPILKVLVQGMFVGALTGLVGAGGGFVIVPALVLLGGLPIELAVGTSLVVIAMNSFAAFAGVAATVTIDGKIAGSLSAAAVVGSIGGSLLAHRVQPATLRAAFGWLVIAMAIFILGQELPPLFHAKASPKLAGALALVATSVFASLRVVWTRKCAQSDVLKLASQSATGGQTP